MDLYPIIDALIEERNRLDRIIQTLESTLPRGRKVLRKKRGRKSMDEAARREVAERMKRYWAKRRAARSAEESGGKFLTAKAS